MSSTPKFYYVARRFYSSEFLLESGLPAYLLMEKAARGEALLAQPLQLHQARMGGRNLHDVLWNSLCPVVHDRVIEIFERAELTGWGKYPVCIKNRAGEVLDGYHWGLSSLGRCERTYLDQVHSRVEYVERASGTFPHYVGLHVPVETWDGSDIFTPAQGSTHRLMTERAAVALRQAGVTNIVLTPVDEISLRASDLPRLPKS